MTKLVVAAHKHCCRVAVRSAFWDPDEEGIDQTDVDDEDRLYRWHGLEVIITPRVPLIGDVFWHEGHPTSEALIERITTG